MKVLPDLFSHNIHLELKKKDVLDQEILLLGRPIWLRQKNVKKKEC